RVRCRGAPAAGHPRHLAGRDLRRRHPLRPAHRPHRAPAGNSPALGRPSARMTTADDNARPLGSHEAAAPRPRWQVLLIRPELMTFVLLILGIIAGSLLSPFFLDINYILSSFTLYAEFAIVALVLTMVIIAGEIDLSPAANMALSACIFAWLQAAGVPVPAA